MEGFSYTMMQWCFSRIDQYSAAFSRYLLVLLQIAWSLDGGDTENSTSFQVLSTAWALREPKKESRVKLGSTGTMQWKKAIWYTASFC